MYINNILYIIIMSDFLYSTIYLYSSVYQYTSDDSILNHFALYVPEEVTVLANSVLNIDMKIKIAVFCPGFKTKVEGLSVVPTSNMLNTPLIMALPGLTISSYITHTDIYIPVRNLSNTDYTIPANTQLFDMVFMSYNPMKVSIVGIDHIMIST